MSSIVFLWPIDDVIKTEEEDLYLAKSPPLSISTSDTSSSTSPSSPPSWFLPDSLEDNVPIIFT